MKIEPLAVLFGILIGGTLAIGVCIYAIDSNNIEIRKKPKITVTTTPRVAEELEYATILTRVCTKSGQLVLVYTEDAGATSRRMMIQTGEPCGHKEYTGNTTKEYSLKSETTTET